MRHTLRTTIHIVDVSQRNLNQFGIRFVRDQPIVAIVRRVKQDSRERSVPFLELRLVRLGNGDIEASAKDRPLRDGGHVKLEFSHCSLSKQAMVPVHARCTIETLQDRSKEGRC